MDIEDCLPSDRIFQITRKQTDSYVIRKPLRRIQPDPDGEDDDAIKKVLIHTFGCSHNYSDSEFMAGILYDAGYSIVDSIEEADICIVNSCTVKNPSESGFLNFVRKCEDAKKRVVLAGCVTQADPLNDEFQRFSIVGVKQFDQIEYVVSETLKGNSVKLLKSSVFVANQFDLPKVRKNPFIEIIPTSSGCLHNCTYCKTKFARGELRSWGIADICLRIEQAISEGVKEIRLTGEDVGAYGIDIGTNIVELLKNVQKINFPDDVMIRVGMANPTYILDHLDDLCEILKHKNFYEFIHIPIQCGSDDLLAQMRREYTVKDFMHVVSTFRKNIPDISIATDIICGYPTETEDDFNCTLSLLEKCKFPFVNISQMYCRPGTAAFIQRRKLRAQGVKCVNSKEVKDRSRRVSKLFSSYETFEKLVGEKRIVWVTELAKDGVSYVAHTKNYVQTLIGMGEGGVKVRLGDRLEVLIEGCGKFFVKGKVLRNLSLQKQLIAVANTADEEDLEAPTVDKKKKCSPEKHIEEEGKGMKNVVTYFSAAREEKKRRESRKKGSRGEKKELYSYRNWSCLIYLFVVVAILIILLWSLVDIEIVYGSSRNSGHVIPKEESSPSSVGKDV